ncbi:ParA family protein [Kribbella catacumbae]|uniref:ParA family protein n=1 Tax=Kribbella catacumbae TaxID=460086 RepID=UPI00037D6105|nr:ParA family protein [Kribbella catacumbae]
MPVIAFLNQKGGVLKTTVTVNVAERLARRGLRVLVIDVDKQAAATSTLLAEEPTVDDRTLADVLRNEHSLDTAIVPTDPPWGGVELVPASLDLEDVWASNKPSLVFRLRRAIDEAELTSRYDYVLLDGPPDLGPGCVSAVIAADHVVVPFRPERMAMHGMARTAETVDVVRRDMRSEVQLTAVLAAAADTRLGEHQNRIDEAASLYGDKLARTVIPHRLKSDEASGFGIPAGSLQGPAGEALGIAYDAFADELIERTKE